MRVRVLGKVTVARFLAAVEGVLTNRCNALGNDNAGYVGAREHIRFNGIDPFRKFKLR